MQRIVSISLVAVFLFLGIPWAMSLFKKEPYAPQESPLWPGYVKVQDIYKKYITPSNPYGGWIAYLNAVLKGNSTPSMPGGAVPGGSSGGGSVF